MRSPSLDVFHAKIDKTIELAQAYTEIDELGFIIRACRLKPQEHLFGKPGYKTRVQYWWIDEFGNSVEITKRKKIKITYNDLRIDRNRLVCTDLYYGLSLKNIATISKLVYLCAGRDEDLNQECFLLVFWGLDNYLRCHLYWYGEWQTVSPLLLGTEHLTLVAQNREIRYHLSLKKNTLLPCVGQKTWLSYLPAKQDFMQMIKVQCPTLLPILETR